MRANSVDDETMIKFLGRDRNGRLHTKYRTETGEMCYSTTDCEAGQVCGEVTNPTTGKSFGIFCQDYVQRKSDTNKDCKSDSDETTLSINEETSTSVYVFSSATVHFSQHFIVLFVHISLSLCYLKDVINTTKRIKI